MLASLIFKKTEGTASASNKALKFTPFGRSDAFTRGGFAIMPHVTAPLSLMLAFIMFAILIISTLLLLFSYLSYRENTHPLWSEYVAVSEKIPKPHGKPNSIEMVFFWKNCSSYKYSTEKDYWNSMAIHCFKEGLLVKRSFFLFWRKPIFISWSKIEEKHNFRAWIAKRRALQIKNTSLYFSITEGAYQQCGKMVKDES